MRLLHIGQDFSLSLQDFDRGPIPKYAILSHRWEKDEVLFEDMEKHSAKTKLGSEKIKGFALKAWNHDFDYCWVDTCCKFFE